MSKILELVGKRVLFRTAQSEKLRDGVVSEISPSKQNICIGYEWNPVDQVRLIEELPDERHPEPVPATVPVNASTPPVVVPPVSDTAAPTVSADGAATPQ